MRHAHSCVDGWQGNAVNQHHRLRAASYNLYSMMTDLLEQAVDNRQGRGAGPGRAEQGWAIKVPAYKQRGRNMKANYWLQRWQDNQIGFHQSEVHPLLVRYLQTLGLRAGHRIFLPLCGKTLDIGWLLKQGFRVCGIDLSTLAVEQLFAGLALEPDISELGELKCYSAPNVDVFAGDVFQLSQQALGEVDAVYDRAALVALPFDMRPSYSAHLTSITRQAPQLLITFVYDQALMAGPPFSIEEGEVQRNYGHRYDLKCLASETLAGGLKGKYPAIEELWLLEAKKSIGRLS